ncbi:MAG: hypothetical protein AB8B77_00730 [Alphaproteobacteria bacterium]
MMALQQYINDIKKERNTGNAREHSYRPALKTLIETLLPRLTAVNEPAHIKCGAPDFIIQHKDKLPIGFKS